MWWVVVDGVEAGTTKMTEVYETLPTSPMDRPSPDVKQLADAGPLPDVEPLAEAGPLPDVDGPLPRPPSVRDLGRQTACSSEEDLSDVMEGRERRVLSCMSAATPAAAAEAEEEEDEEAAAEEEDETGTDADMEDEVELYPMGADERLDQMELDLWKLVTASVPLGGACVAILAVAVAVMVACRG